jgi:hypothetical protein
METLNYIYWLVIKDITKFTREEMQRARHLGKGVELPKPLHALHPQEPPRLQLATNSLNPVPLGFYRAFIT